MLTLGVRFGFVQRSKGQKAVNRSSYQRHRFVINGVRPRTFFNDGEQIIHSKNFLPSAAPKHLNDTRNLWTLASAAELRRDAIEARTIDLTIPRIFSQQTAIIVCEELAAIFLQMQLAVQLDLHLIQTANFETNLHAHFMISVRSIDKTGFSKLKSTALELAFCERRGRGMREKITAIINEHSLVEFGFKITRADQDPTIQKPEPRLPRWIAKSQRGKEYLSLRRQILYERSLWQDHSALNIKLFECSQQIEKFENLILSYEQQKNDTFENNQDYPVRDLAENIFDSPDDTEKLDAEDVDDDPDFDSQQFDHNEDYEADEPNDEPFDMDEPEY